MAPKINVGDLICWVSVREISSGDIVVFEQNGKRVAHRVLRVEGDNVAVRGDSALSKIELISASQICGKCVVSFSVGNLFIVILIVSVLFGFSGAFFFHKIKKG